jgi:Mg2+/citrate symporter
MELGYLWQFPHSERKLCWWRSDANRGVSTFHRWQYLAPTVASALLVDNVQVSAPCLIPEPTTALLVLTALATLMGLSSRARRSSARKR